jgi:hypothetical protein
VASDPSALHYDLYTFVNTTGIPQCVTVTINPGGCGASSFGLESNAYLGSFNPASICANYLGGYNDQITGTPATYSFTVPAGATFVIEAEEFIAGTGCASYTVTVGSCAISQPPNPPVVFSDVPPSQPFYPYIQCLTGHGIVNGYADGTFRPNAGVTRGQVAKIVATAADFSDKILPTQQTFSDVPASHPFWQWIERVAAHGVVSGYADGTFRPSDAVTRAQLAKIAANAAGYQEPVSSQTFSDVPLSHPFYAYIERMALHGGLNGYSDGTFRPGSGVTRGQTAKIVRNTFFPDCAL